MTRATISRGVILAVVAFAAVACIGAGSSLAGIGPVSRLIVKPVAGPSLERVITDSATINAVLHFAKSTQGWTDIWDTPPAGEWSVTLMRDTTALGVIWFSEKTIMSRRYQPYDRYVQTFTPTDEQAAELRGWLGIPRS